MFIASIETAQPPNYYNQEELLAAFQKLWNQTHHNPRRVEQLHKAVQVDGRHLALTMEEYSDIKSFTESNNHYIRVGTDIGENAVRKALQSANLKPADVDAIFFVSVTGIATPSIDAKLVNRLGLRSDVKRIPIFGLGCVAGAAGLARVHDYLKAYPEQVALLLSVELCSLTLQQGDLSVANLIASGLFGDGAACVVGVGNIKAKEMNLSSVQIQTSRSRFYPDTEKVMGWDIGADGFRVVLQARVPQLAEEYLQADLESFLSDQSLCKQDITQWVCHTGGPKVLIAFQKALGLSEQDLQLSWKSLRTVGNLSSASVLYVLKDTIEQKNPNQGDKGILLAMGPGFCCEMVLLEW
jgi:alkylresorcinol/alkylpyrone synthase